MPVTRGGTLDADGWVSHVCHRVTVRRYTFTVDHHSVEDIFITPSVSISEGTLTQNPSLYWFGRADLQVVSLDT